MQIFLIDKSPIETAKILDRKRLNKQVLECDWMITATDGSRVTKHPIYKMYKDHMQWVIYYRNCLRDYRDGDMELAEKWSMLADKITPEFLCQEYFDNFKKRLYTKDPEFYSQFGSEYGKTENNWYYFDGAWHLYQNGKRIN